MFLLYINTVESYSAGSLFTKCKKIPKLTGSQEQGLNHEAWTSEGMNYKQEAWTAPNKLNNNRDTPRAPGDTGQTDDKDTGKCDHTDWQTAGKGDRPN